jgi:hypothetical protein
MNNILHNHAVDQGNCFQTDKFCCNSFLFVIYLNPNHIQIDFYVCVFVKLLQNTNRQVEKKSNLGLDGDSSTKSMALVGMWNL